MPPSHVTPALCAFAEGLAFRVVEENADTVRRFLETEAVLYKAVFEGFTLSRRINSGKRTMRDFFCDYVLNESIVKAPANLIPELSPPIHDEYWQLAEDERFWPKGKQNGADELLPFADLLVVWGQQRHQRVANLTQLLERLDGVLRS
jgi:hypothetical protein